MAYFVVERSRDDGTLSIPLPDAYESRDAAIAALSSATASGAISLQGEVFIADLGSAVPVLVMPVAPAVAPAAAEPVPVSDAGAAEADEAAAESEVAAPDEASVEPGELDEATAEEAFSSWEPLGEVEAAGASLADALKRAATSLEEEGIVAPDSIVSEAEPDLDETPAAPEETQEPEETEEAEVAESAAEVLEDDEAAWPWANVESYEIKVDASDLLAADEQDAEAESIEPTLGPEDATEDAPEDETSTETGAEQESELGPTASATAVVPEEQAIITSAPAEGEDAYLPKPVILGDYLESLSAVIEEEPVGSEEPEEPAEAEAPGGPAIEMPELAALDEPEEPGEPAEAEESGDAGEAPAPEPAEPESAGVGLSDKALTEEADASAAVAVPEVGYEATGELKLEEYTCQDCVYSNTCPKVGQTTPAECGSFQWRSE